MVISLVEPGLLAPRGGAPLHSIVLRFLRIILLLFLPRTLCC